MLQRILALAFLLTSLGLSQTQIDLTQQVKGALPIANGGNGRTSVCAANQIFISDGSNYTSCVDPLDTTDIDTEAELEAILTDVTNVFTDNDTIPAGNLGAHATAHQNGGSDEVATATPAANAIPKAEADGDINVGWVPQDTAYTWTGLHEFDTDIDVEDINGIRFCDEFASLQACIDDLPASGGVAVARGDYSISSTLTLDGDNEVLLCSWEGQGTVFDGGATPATLRADGVITWTGSAGGVMIDIVPPTNGKIYGVGVIGCTLDANTTNIADIAIQLKALVGGLFKGVSIINCDPDSGEGCIDITSGDNAAATTHNVRSNDFIDVEILQRSTAAGAGIYARRGTGATAGDMNQNLFQSLRISYYGEGGVYCDACDGNTWVEPRFTKLAGSGDGWVVPSGADICGQELFYAFGGTYNSACNTTSPPADMIFGWDGDSDPDSSVTVSNTAHVIVHSEGFGGVWARHYTASGRFSPYHRPEDTFRLVEEFFGGSNLSGEIGELGWTFPNGQVTATFLPSRPGARRLGTTTTINTYGLLHLINGRIDPASTDNFRSIWRIALVDNDSDTQVRVGFGNDSTADPPDNGIYIEKDEADTTWHLITRSSATETDTDTTVSTSTDFIDVAIWRKDASNVCTSINGANETCSTTNIPTALLNPFASVFNATAANKRLDLGFMELEVDR